MRAAMALAMVSVMACGDPLVPQSYRGEGIAALDLQIEAEGEPTAGALRAAVFWATDLSAAGDFDRWIEAPGTSRPVARPQETTLGLFDAPTGHLLEYAPGRRAAFGSVFVYVDASGDGRRQSDEAVVGQLDERLVLYTPTQMTAQASPTGRALAAGVHVVPPRLPCHRVDRFDTQPCATPIGQRCTEDEDCAGGVCLPETAVCAHADADLGCTAAEAAFVVDLPQAADRPTRYLLPICDAGCQGDACPQRCVDAAPRTVVRFRGHVRPPWICDDPAAPAHGFICVDAARCEQRSGCFYREFGGSAYLACGFRIAWAEASAFCQQFGGHLVTLDTADEEAFLLNQGFDGWIGLNDQLEEGDFVWANGSTAGYRNWNTPFSGNALREEDCAVMKRHPRRVWVLDPCEDNKPFICEARFE